MKKLQSNDSMLIGIDGNEANQKIRVGSGVYAFELLQQFKKINSSSSKIKFKIYLKDKPLDDLPIESENWQYKIVGPKKLWTQVGLPFKLWQEKLTGTIPDIFYSPNHYAPRFSPIPTVITIFDLSFIHFPDLFVKRDLYQLKNWTSYSVKRAKKIITISEFSKKEIVDYYKLPDDKVVVAYPGYDGDKYKISNIKNKKYLENIKNKYKIDGEYILFVGTIQPRKNVARLIEAFTILDRKAIKREDRLKLVICGMINEGRGGWMQEEFFQKIKELNLDKEVIITGYIPEEEIPYLMGGAKAFVLPSLYEGFGIPVLEAMAVGIPVVVSRISSLPEVCGKAAIYIEDPKSSESIYLALNKALELSGKERENLVKLGLIQAQRFSWQKTAEKILDNLID